MNTTSHAKRFNGSGRSSLGGPMAFVIAAASIPISLFIEGWLTPRGARSLGEGAPAWAQGMSTLVVLLAFLVMAFSPFFCRQSLEKKVTSFCWGILCFFVDAVISYAWIANTFGFVD